MTTIKKHVYWTLARLGQRMSLSWIERLGGWLGDLFWHALPSRKRTAVEAIRIHLGVSSAEAERIARESFQSNFRSFLELFKVHQVDRVFLAKRVAIECGNVIKSVLESRRPVVLVSGHLGAWEFMPMVISIFLGGAKITIPARQPKDLAMHEVMTWLRQTNEITIIPHRRAVGELLRNLKQDGFAGFLVDHNTIRQEAVFLPFLGELAAVNKGPALLAVKMQAFVLPMVMIRQPGNRYRVIADAPLDTATLTGNRDDKVQAVAEFYTQAIERQVRAYPEQWFWMHKRWKTRPENEIKASQKQN